MSEIFINQIRPWLLNDSRWLFISLAIASLIGFYWVFRDKNHSSPIQNISSKKFWIPSFCSLAIIFFAWCFYYQLLPKIKRLPRNSHVILVMNFKYVTEDVKNEAENYPDMLVDELEVVSNNKMLVKRLNINIEGNDITSNIEYAREIGFKKAAHIVIFGKVRKNQNGNDEVKTVIVLTQGPVKPFSSAKLIDLNDSEIKEKNTLDLTNSDAIVLEYSDKCATINFYLGHCYYNLKKYEDSITAYNNAIKRNPKVAFFYNNRGNSYVAKGKNREAIKSFDEALNLDPLNAEFYSNKGGAFVGLKKFPEAIEACQRAIELDSNYCSAYNNLGVAFMDSDKNKEAIIAFTEAIKLKKNPTFYANRGEVFLKEKKYKEAIKDFSSAINIDPAIDYYHQRGSAYSEIEEYDKAIIDFKKIIEINPEYEQAYKNIGILLERQGRVKEAKTFLKKAQEMNKKNKQRMSQNI